MQCRKLCTDRRSGKKSLPQFGAEQAHSYCGRWNPNQDSSLLRSYGGACSLAEFARGMKNSIAAGGCKAASFLRSARGEASWICFISEAATSKERWTRKTSARSAREYFS